MAYRALRKLLFRLDPERAHALGLGVLARVGRRPGLLARLERRMRVVDPRLEQVLWQKRFPNPVGLAAGFDKDAVAVPALGALGFGFLEVGTVTPRAQPGNPRPRLFRYPGAESLENALGFNNGGAAALRERLATTYPARVPLGINLGKNRETPLERALDDYASLFESLAESCDYLVVNVSSPNTPGLRELQNRRTLRRLLELGRAATGRPILVKIAPDMETAAAVELCARAVEDGAAGIILSNTTTDYDLLPVARRVGGLSGAVLREKSFRLLQAVADELFGSCVLVSVGGVDSAAETLRRLAAGASLVQLYTALVYRGPGLVKRILAGLVEQLDRVGAGSLAEVVGSAVGAGRRRGRVAEEAR